LAGLFSGFVLPKFLDPDQYGYVRLFAFYTSYVGFLHFGFNDGIYIRYASYEYDELPRNKFSVYFWVISISQTVISLLMILYFKFYINEPVRYSVIFFVCLNVVILNVTTFFNFINQITRRFRIYANNTILSKALYMLISTVLLFAGIRSYIFYIATEVIINFAVLLIYGYSCRDLAFGKVKRYDETLKDLSQNITIGFFVMMGNFTGSLVWGIGQYFIDRFFPLSDFAVYSFAVNLIGTAFYVFMPMATIVYPYLARVSKENIGRLYARIELILFMITGSFLAAFFILKPIITAYLPYYTDSMNILLILFPVLIYNAQRSILQSNFYKIMMYQRAYTINNASALVVSILMCGTAYYVFKSTVAVSIASIAGFYIWLVYSDYFFSRRINFNFLKMHIVEFLTSIVFWVTGFAFKWYIGLALYMAGFLMLLYLFYREDLLLLKEKKSGYLSC